MHKSELLHERGEACSHAILAICMGCFYSKLAAPEEFAGDGLIVVGTAGPCTDAHALTLMFYNAAKLYCKPMTARTRHADMGMCKMLCGAARMAPE